jgi:hypothetical protein
MIALSLPLGQPRLVLACPRNPSPHVRDLIISPLGPTMMFSQVNMCILMVRPRMWLKPPAKFISPPLTSSHLPILSVQDYSFLTSILCYWRGFAPQLPVQLRFTSSRLVLPVVYWRGIALIIPVTLRFTSSWLVLHVVYWRGIAPSFQYNSILLVRG